MNNPSTPVAETSLINLTTTESQDERNVNPSSDAGEHLSSTRSEPVNKSPGILDDHTDSDERGSYVVPRYHSMAWLAQNCPEGCNDMVPKIEEMGDCFLRYVNGHLIKGSWRYIADVILYDDMQYLRSIVRDYGRSRRNGMFGYSVEPGHVHIIHDCCYAGSHCCDAFRRQIQPLGSLRPSRPANRPIYQFTRTDWYSEYFKDYAEEIPTGITCQALSKAAQESKVIVVGGSIPEIDNGKLYNTCTVWNEMGGLIAKFRKIHLFDIDIPGKIVFKESESLCPGDKLATFTIGDVKIGLGICYDLRFSELARIYADEGCSLLIYPGAFNMTTGPLHWELLGRSRALDNQLWVALVSPARDEAGDYVAWGHSSIFNPWGHLTKSTEHEEDVVFQDIDLGVIDQVRSQIPLTTQRRLDIYKTVNLTSQ